MNAVSQVRPPAPTSRPRPPQVTPAPRKADGPGTTVKAVAATAGVLGGATVGFGAASIALSRINPWLGGAVGAIAGAVIVGKGVTNFASDAVAWIRGERQTTAAGMVGATVGLAVGGAAGFGGSFFGVWGLCTMLPALNPVGLPLLILGTVGTALAGAALGSRLLQK